MSESQNGQQFDELNGDAQTENMTF